MQTAIPVVLTAVLAGQVAVTRTDRCGPLMTVVVPWAILQISPTPLRSANGTTSSDKVRNDTQTVTRYASATHQNRERPGKVR